MGFNKAQAPIFLPYCVLAHVLSNTLKAIAVTYSLGSMTVRPGMLQGMYKAT